jgi:hypothetical protein
MSDPVDPFLPLLDLSPETLQHLFPYIVRAIDEDLAGGQITAELTNLRNTTRAHLQHYDIWVEW